ncbi:MULTISPECIES: hypothetical protein [Micromonospora]|uniref:hypothetical protein n=1 Tax=Micromonospora TaxID=1873 RepID=UPI00191C44D9|nr:MULTISPECIES: hypothetical protein [unclassified Micromonospora]MBM0224297.1 hypothetical protein [Micromonospora sp. ATA51]
MCISIVGVDRIPISSPVDRGMFGYYEFRGGANLAPEQAVGRRTWEEFLAERAH